MKKIIVFNCPICNSKMYFDNYILKYVCKNCNKSFEFANLENGNEETYTSKSIQDLKIMYKKKDYFNELHKLKNNLKLAPRVFSKVKTLEEKDIKLLYFEVALINATIVLSTKNENIKYTFSNYPYFNNLNFNLDIIEKIMPLDFKEIEENKVNYQDNLIELKDSNEDLFLVVKNELLETIKDRVKLDNIKEEYNIFMPYLEINYFHAPIYDYSINYQDRSYHFTMNANTRKFGYSLVYDKKKIFYYEIGFLVLDIIIFYLMYLLKINILLIIIFLFLGEFIALFKKIYCILKDDNYLKLPKNYVLDLKKVKKQEN